MKKDDSVNTHLVCIGASVGGLDALERFFNACPVDTGAAFVVIQHLSPDHKSMMSNLLARHTQMPIILVEDNMVLEPNRLHLIPPGVVMHVNRTGHLHLTPKSTRSLTLPIDIFFSSMAESYGSKAVGIILSGTGTDGTRGAEAIKAVNGFLMVQDPESSKFDGMPRSAIATGLIDVIQPAEDLPEFLVAHVRNLPIPKTEKTIRIVPHAQMASADVIQAILKLINQIGGIDFAEYKVATVMRRIERRMQLKHITELYQYFDLLEHDYAELITLRREMLISVTSFFRDPDTFDALFDKVILPMVAEMRNEEVVRVWTAGVATGEEAYTLAMLFIEAFEKIRRWPNIKIFATDVDQSSIDFAGAGQYPESAASELSSERLARFFIKKGESFAVKNELRQCIIFARHNLLSDPPFTRMDLVVCRNTLIYFKSGAQERVLSSLQYAMRDNGILLLGSSESLANANDGMQPIDAKHKLFKKVGLTNPPFINHKTEVGNSQETRIRRNRAISYGADHFADQALALLMRRYAPPAIIINDRHEIVHLFGDLKGLLHPREGSASLEINRQLIDSLVPVASALIYKTERENENLISEPVSIKINEKEQKMYRISSFPIEKDGVGRMTLLCFEQISEPTPTVFKEIDVNAETTARINMLERELMATRENLQATIEELETSNEELQATNEELMASNEELQSSNEELQSLNEEMGTVNAEFKEKMFIINSANADLDSMLQVAGLATIFVDENMHITRFSPDAKLVFKLRASDIGRKLDDIAHNLSNISLIDDIETTINTGYMNEYEAISKDGKHCFMTRILPYVVPSTTTRGAVITFIDITAYHDARNMQKIIDALSEHIAVLDSTGTIVMVNTAWRNFAINNGDPEMKYTGVGVNYLEVCNANIGNDTAIAAKVAEGLKQLLDGNESNFRIEYPCHSPTEQRWFAMNAVSFFSNKFGAVVSHINISSWKTCEQQTLHQMCE